jgi:hypothetical protein
VLGACGGSRVRNLPAQNAQTVQSLLLDVEVDVDVGADGELAALDELEELSLEAAGAAEVVVLDDEVELEDVPEPRLSVL